ncbi:MAG: hypothetical protein ACP5D2_04080 [Candidatus Nanoarchaeia archaeon]
MVKKQPQPKEGIPIANVNKVQCNFSENSKKFLCEVFSDDFSTGSIDFGNIKFYQVLGENETSFSYNGSPICLSKLPKETICLVSQDFSELLCVEKNRWKTKDAFEKYKKQSDLMHKNKIK